MSIPTSSTRKERNESPSPTSRATSPPLAPASCSCNMETSIRGWVACKRLGGRLGKEENRRQKCYAAPAKMLWCRRWPMAIVVWPSSSVWPCFGFVWILETFIEILTLNNVMNCGLGWWGEWAQHSGLGWFNCQLLCWTSSGNQYTSFSVE